MAENQSTTKNPGRITFSVPLKIPEQFNIFHAAFSKYCKENKLDEETALKTYFFLTICKYYSQATIVPASSEEINKVVADLRTALENAQEENSRLQQELTKQPTETRTSDVDTTTELQSLHDRIAQLEDQLQTAETSIEEVRRDYLLLSLASDDMQRVQRAMQRWLNANPGMTPEKFVWKLFKFTHDTALPSSAIHLYE